MRFDDEPPLWREMWKPFPIPDRLEAAMIFVVLALPGFLVLKHLFG